MPRCLLPECQVFQQSAEQLAEDAVEGGNISQAMAERVLSLLVFPNKGGRNAAMPKGASKLQRMVQGLYAHGSKVELTNDTKAIHGQRGC